ncbi:PIF1-like helicase [Fragilaria crotonensis]|nr:PIF1-like helicase [Fragilaria crotonensis]
MIGESLPSWYFSTSMPNSLGFGARSSTLLNNWLAEAFCHQISKSPCSPEENYPDLAEAFSACKLVEVKKDPELWFNDLDHLNMRIGRINAKYEKDELQMKSHIMNSMLTGYDPVIVKFRGELADTTLTKLRKEIVLQCKSLLKVKGKSTSESALMANMNKHPYKKFKGICRNCGKIGHKAAECRSKAVEGSDEVGGKGKTSSAKSNVTCYNCGEKGHYSNKCTKPKKSKATSDPTSDMAMFVGVTGVVEKEWDEKDNQKERNGGEINNWQDSELFSFEQTCGDIHTDFDVAFERPVIMTTTAEDVHTEIVESTALTVINHPRGNYAGHQVSNEFVGSSGTDNTEEWLLDSGATSGVTYDKTLMTDMRPSNRKIEIGNGDMVETLGQGTVTLTDNDGTLVSFTDVYYAPAFTKHIVSFRQLIENNWSLSKVTRNEFVWDTPMSTAPVRFKINDKDRLCYFDGTRTPGPHDRESVNNLTASPVTLDINVAHGLLGHPDTRTVNAMAAKQGWTLTGTVKPCGSCALAKARAKTVPKSTLTKAKAPGERLFLDISGPYSDSLNQNKYWLRIVDDHTRFSWDCFLPKKSGIHIPLANYLR